MRIRGDSLFIADSRQEAPIRYSLTDIERVEITQHDESRAEPLWAGLLIGAAFGALVGAALGKDCPAQPSGSMDWCLGRGGAAVGGGLAGGGIGALISIPFVADLKYYRRDE